MALFITTKRKEDRTMTANRQLALHAAVAFISAALTVALLSWIHREPPPLPQRVPLIHSTLVQIEVPYGLLPSLELANPAFGMENGQLAWIAPEHFADVAMPYTGRQPDAWPEVPKYEPPTRSRNQARYSGW
jgi:hypothetical protein